MMKYNLSPKNWKFQTSYCISSTEIFITWKEQRFFVFQNKTGNIKNLNSINQTDANFKLQYQKLQCAKKNFC